ncbi:hypothetical protein [Azorhizobium doebereinerae]|uniref:hypothetical protein n=1 Tax=Azorhizobium doebereinerae TaxID=281091 RepID=UPI0018DD498F|nr:hypothetical protein [Azorhizobium doebereinerae]
MNTTFFAPATFNTKMDHPDGREIARRRPLRPAKLRRRHFRRQIDLPYMTR